MTVTRSRAASRATGVSWAIGFGGTGGMLGPVAGGVLIGAGLPLFRCSYAFGATALLGARVVLATRFTSQVPARGVRTDPAARSTFAPSPTA